MKLVIGLGNPGKEYENTRHNAGFLALDAYAETNGLRWSDDARRKALTAKGSVDGQQVLLAKPQTFMNLSGETVSALASFYKVEPTDVLVVHDEMDLLPGGMTFKLGGGDAGHNGIASVIERLGTKEFARLRIGIGRPTPPMTPENWVLGKIESATKNAALLHAPEAIQDWISTGLTSAMNAWNQR